MVYDNSPKAIEKRFLTQVHKYTNGCWIWVGSKLNNGYGKIQLRRKNLLAHRLSYELFKNKIPDGYQIDHICRNRDCVNPDHLEAVTGIQNNERRVGFKEKKEIDRIRNLEPSFDLNIKKIHNELLQKRY